jgi:hypothetical protein
MNERFDVYVGMRNPRDRTEIGWRFWDSFPTFASAKHAIRALGETAIARIDKAETIYQQVPAQGE